MSRCLRSFAVLLLTAATALAQTAPDGEPQRDPADDDTAAWAKRLLDRQNATIDTLAARGASCLPLLRQLHRDVRENVRRGVARTCERLGPAAMPLWPELLADLTGPGEWWTHLYAAQALAAIRPDAPAVLDALLDHGLDSPVPQLRSICGRSFAALTDDPTERVLTAHRQGLVRDDERAISFLLAFGDDAVPRQIALLLQQAESDATRELLTLALVRRGWQVARQLERAGLGELAQRALLLGPLQKTAFGEDFALRLTQLPTPAAQLPRIRWEKSAGSGYPLSLLRADDQPEGFAVARIFLRYGRRGEPMMQLDRTVVPRARAADAVRQLEVLASAELEQLREPEGHGWSSSGHYDRVRAERDGEGILDTCFHGRAAAVNMPLRFRAEAARIVLDELLRDVVWQVRDAGDADREQVRAALARDGDADDIVTHLRHLEVLLGPKRD